MPDDYNVMAAPIYKAAFFEQALLTDVPVRDANGVVVLNPDGSVQTTRGELRDLLVPMAGDRATALAQAARNHKVFVEMGNAWVGRLQRVLHELERVRPTGKAIDKQGGDGKIDASISAETANTLWNIVDGSGTRFLQKYFNFTSAELAPYLLDPSKFPGFTSSVKLNHMTDKQSFSIFDNAMKSVVDQATQKVQLDQSTLQGLVSRQNNAIEAMADLQQKFAATFDKLVANFRPPR